MLVRSHDEEPGGVGAGGSGFASVEQVAEEVALVSNPIGNIARTLVVRAIEAQVSTIQMELGADGVAVYYHRDSDVHREMSLPASVFRPVVTRYKMWADVDLLIRRYPLKGQFPLIHRRRHYSVDVTWEDPWPHRNVTLSIVPGAEAQEEDDEQLF